MKVLFIKPSISKSKRFKIKLLNFYNNNFGFEDISAFFEASLREVFKVKRMGAREAILKKEWVNKNFDLVVVDYRADILAGIENKKDNAIEISKNFSIPKVLFASTDKTITLPDNEVLDKYNVIFKREPFSDLDRYDISEENKKKICSTMLSCPFVRRSKFKYLSLILSLFYPKYKKNKNYEYDVYFSGPGIKEGRIVENYKNRNKIWQRVRSEGFKVIGGIIPREGEYVDKNIRGVSIRGEKYIKTINSSKICLAIDGVGNFTYRHLELFYSGAFVLSTDSIDKLNLPIKIQNGVDYVSFSSVDDMVEKIKYYIEHEEEREKIAKKGREKFEKYYNIKRHGEYIETCIKISLENS